MSKKQNPNQTTPESEKEKKDPSSQNGGETFGNEPPVKDPKPAKRPDRYELGSH